MGLAIPVEQVPTAGLAPTCLNEAIGEGFAVVSQHRLNGGEGLLFGLIHEHACILRGLAASDLQIHHPARRPADSHVQVAHLPLVGQMLDVDVHITRFVAFERLGPGGSAGILSSQFRSVVTSRRLSIRCKPERNSRVFRSSRVTISRSSRPRRRKERAASNSSSCSGGSVASRQVVPRMRPAMDIILVPPTANRRYRQAGQLAIADADGGRLELGMNLRCGGGLLMQLDEHDSASR